MKSKPNLTTLLCIYESKDKNYHLDFKNHLTGLQLEHHVIHEKFLEVNMLNPAYAKDQWLNKNWGADIILIFLSPGFLKAKVFNKLNNLL